jgi:hypothetical protein
MIHRSHPEVIEEMQSGSGSSPEIEVGPASPAEARLLKTVI